LLTIDRQNAKPVFEPRGLINMIGSGTFAAVRGLPWIPAVFRPEIMRRKFAYIVAIN
jgi:hypothetical protein